MKSADPTATASGFRRALTTGATLGAGISVNPTFNFVPLTGDIFAKIFLKQISEETFGDFFKMNYHADVLLRTMVQSVEIKSADGSTDTWLVNHPGTGSYADFLEFADELNLAQEKQMILVKAGEAAPQQQLSLKLKDQDVALSTLLSRATISVDDGKPAPEKSLTISLLPAPAGAVLQAKLEKEMAGLSDLRSKLAADQRTAAADKAVVGALPAEVQTRAVSPWRTPTRRSCSRTRETSPKVRGK